MTEREREDAIDALGELRQAIRWLEAGESSLEEVARVYADNHQYIEPILTLAGCRCSKCVIRREAGYDTGPGATEGAA